MFAEKENGMVREENDDFEREGQEEEYMTRAEWVKYARIECEKQLPVFKEELEEESNEEIEEEDIHAVYVPLSEEDEDEQEETIERITREIQAEADMEEEEDEEEGYKNPILHAMQFDDVIPLQGLEKIKWSYVRKLGVRAAAAAVIALFAISIDIFGIRSEYISGDKIQEAIAKNDMIENVEQAVSEFVKDSVLPVFQK